MKATFVIRYGGLYLLTLFIGGEDHGSLIFDSFTEVREAKRAWTMLAEGDL